MSRGMTGTTSAGMLAERAGVRTLVLTHVNAHLDSPAVREEGIETSLQSSTAGLCSVRSCCRSTYSSDTFGRGSNPRARESLQTSSGRRARGKVHRVGGPRIRTATAQGL